MFTSSPKLLSSSYTGASLTSTCTSPGLAIPYFYPCPYPYPYHWGHPVSLAVQLHGVARHTRRRKARTVFSTEQMAMMESKFAEQRYLSIPTRLKLAQDLGLSEQQVCRKGTHAQCHVLPDSHSIIFCVHVAVKIIGANCMLLSLLEELLTVRSFYT